MDLRKLEHFMEVAVTGSFTKASQKLHIAQPAISKSIQKLEEELELILFDRSEKSAQLTSEGKVLLKHAVEIMDKMKATHQEMRELKGLQSGEIQIGLPSMFSSGYFPPIIKAFKKKYPRVRINVTEEGTMEIRSLIEQKEVDLGIISYQPAELEAVASSMQIEPLLIDELVACMPIDHPLAERSSVTLSELLHEPLVLFKKGYYQRKLLEEASNYSGIPLHITFTSNQLSLIRSLVIEGLGITLFLRMVTHADKRVRSIPLNPPVYIHLGIGHKKDTYISIASRAFIDFMKQYLQNKGDHNGESDSY
ncbi:LysR family transcriptional regulator [Paenibacillus jiagnxiensis]|uniref:LysR family transcriptional regulator n=1 Tax=Paenibacillus jiagnxiensis TaxID=3228926 RepID=UPI0038D41417